MENNRIKVEQAAEELNMCTAAVRYLMDDGTLPIGAIKRSGKRKTYYIYRSMLDAYLKKRGGE